MIKKIKQWFYERKMIDVQTFAQKHRSMLVIVLDPRDDTAFISHRGKQVCGKFKSLDGKNHHVVKNVLKHSVFEREFDRLVGGLMEMMKLPLEHGAPFFQFLDGALYNISKALKQKKAD